MTDIVRAHVLVRGIVQGVAFRAFTEHRALRRRLRGGVRNMDDGRVETFLEGPREDVLAVIEELKAGPPRARVDDVAVTWETPSGTESTFCIWY
jgi:acylphosphatase